MALSTRCRALVSTSVLLLAFASLAGADDGSARLVGPFTRDDYPQAVIDRPLTLPAGMVEGEIGGQFISQRLGTPIVFFVPSFDDWNLDLAIRVGITDRVQLEAGTAFSLDHRVRNPFGFEGGSGFDPRPNLTSWQRMIPVRLSVLALDTEAVDTAVTLTLPFVAYAERRVSVFRGGTLVLRNSNGRALPEVDLGAPTRWRLTDWFWFRAGQDLFGVGTADGTAVFAFNFGIGVQPHPMFAATLDSRIAAVFFDGQGHSGSTTLADLGTIALEGTFTPIRCLDIVGDFDIPDVGNGVDAYAIRTAVRVRF